MRIGKYYISYRKLWTSFLAIATYLESIHIAHGSWAFPVQLICGIALAFNISPTEKFTPWLFEKDATQALDNVTPLIPASLANDLSDLVALLKAGQGAYSSGIFIPPPNPPAAAAPVISPSPVIPPTVSGSSAFVAPIVMSSPGDPVVTIPGS